MLRRPLRSLPRPLVLTVVLAAMLGPATALGQTPPVLASAEVPPGAVAVVRGDSGAVFATIGEAQYERFFSAALSQAQQRPSAKAVPLVAPDFAACVHSTNRWAGSGERPRTQGARRRACARKHAEISNTAVRQLLSLNWIAAEADRRVMVFTERRLARAIRTIINVQFDGRRGYERFLRDSTLNDDDVRLEVLAQLAQTAIVRQIKEPWADSDASEDLDDRIEAQEAQQRAINEFRTDFLLRSAEATTCAPAYATLPACTDDPNDDPVD